MNLQARLASAVRFCALFLLALLLLALLLLAPLANSPAAAEDWPSFLGPNRDGRSPETDKAGGHRRIE